MWGSCDETKLQLLQKIQNRVARIVTGNFDFSTNSQELIKQLGWMNMSQRHFYFTAVLMLRLGTLSLLLQYVTDLKMSKTFITRKRFSEKTIDAFTNSPVFILDFYIYIYIYIYMTKACLVSCFVLVLIAPPNHT